jgi:archaellum component FlaC
MSTNNNEAINELLIEDKTTLAYEENNELEPLECNYEVVNLTNEEAEAKEKHAKNDELVIELIKEQEIITKDTVDSTDLDKASHESLKHPTHNKHEQLNEASHKLQDQINKLADNFELLKDNFASITPVLQGITPALIDITSVIKDMKSTLEEHSKEVTEVVDENMETYSKNIADLTGQIEQQKQEMQIIKTSLQKVKPASEEFCEKVISYYIGPLAGFAARSANLDIIKNNQIKTFAAVTGVTFLLPYTGICKYAPTVVESIETAATTTKEYGNDLINKIGEIWDHYSNSEINS